MVKINRIYTRTGDDGSTGLVGGMRVPKDSLRVEAYGAVDELNAMLGMLRTLILREVKESLSTNKPLEKLEAELAVIQNELFDLGALLATPAGSGWEGMAKISEAQVLRLERGIDDSIKGLPELKSFVLPGGTEINAWLHIARTVCRRAERRVITLSRQELVDHEIIRYLNRLSDLLFGLARSESSRSGCKEFLWVPGSVSSGGTAASAETGVKGEQKKLIPQKATSKRQASVKHVKQSAKHRSK